MKSILLITFCFLGLPCSLSYSQDFISDSLYPVYGATHYKGIEDNQSSIRLTSVNNCIEISFEVMDDTINLSNNIWNSDHVELWFCMNNKPNNFVVWEDTFYASNHEIHINKDERISFLNFIKSHPKKKKDSITISNIDVVKELTGMVHFGVNPKTDSITLFDTEFYQKGSINLNLNNFIDVKKIFLKNGYQMTLTLRPEAFIFFETVEISELYMMADIFDVDSNEKDLSVLSTTKNRAWGEPKVFSRIHLSKPLRISKNKNSYLPINGFYKYDGKNWQYCYTLKETLLPNDTYYSFSYRDIRHRRKASRRRK